MSLPHLPPLPQPAHPSIHPLHHHHPNHLHDDPYTISLPDEPPAIECQLDVSTDLQWTHIEAQLSSVNRVVELVSHGILAFVSVYAVGSIISTMRFQATHNYTSLTSVFLFLTTGLSVLAALVYIPLAWWARTATGLEKIRSHLRYRQQQQQQQSGEKPAVTSSHISSWSVRTAVVLLSFRPRLGITIAMAGTTMLAAILQKFKVKDASNCQTVPAPFHHFCQTINAAVISTFITSFIWTVWFAYWICIIYCYKYQPPSLPPLLPQFQSQRQHTRQQDEDLGSHQKEDSPQARAIPERQALSAKSDDISKAIQGILTNQILSQSHSPSSSQAHSHDQNSTNNQSQEEASRKTYNSNNNKSNVDITSFAPGPISMDSEDSLGLGIDIQKHGSISPSAEISTAAAAAAAELQEYAIERAGSISGFSMSGPRSASIYEGVHDFSRSERLRDHAKIFPRSHSTTFNSTMYGPQGGGGCRNTPSLYSREQMLVHGAAAASSPALSPSMATTPTTPMGRGAMGYMGQHTIKTLNNLPRSASLGYIAAMNAHSAAASVQASPVVGGGGCGMTPRSAQSNRSMSFLRGSSSAYSIISQADAAAAEQSMDEHLKSVRRRSFAAQVGSGSMTAIAAVASAASITMAPELCGMTAGGGGGRGSEVSIHAHQDFKTGPESPTRGSNFRLSFSSPNLNNFRRKTSLGLKSVLTSMVASPVSDSFSDCSSSSSSSSPSLSSPSSFISQDGAETERGPDTDTMSLSQRSNRSNEQQQQQKQQAMSLSAQDLMQLEYGDIFAGLQRSYSALNLTDLTSGITGASSGEDSVMTTMLMEPYAQQGNAGGSTSFINRGRPRSCSVSSANTAHSTLTTKTNSSDSSSSANSTLTTKSNLTTLSASSGASVNNNKPSPGPPLSFMNRILVGNYHSRGQKHHQHHHHYHNRLMGGQATHSHPRHGQLRRGESAGNLSYKTFEKMQGGRVVIGHGHGKNGSGIIGNGGESRKKSSKKFPSHSDLTPFSWDYRKEVHS
ncbi:hypothetical protein BG004_007568 [Podila humilis]|nr:hypothetical protein BG004_007568 [Podila humilis]